MKELARYLKEAREARGVSLEQLHDVTKIRLCYLEAMESGDFDAIPGPVYVRGFLRSYAGCVGLDPSEVLRRYEAACAPETPVKNQAPSLPPRQTRRAGRFKMQYLWVALGAAVVAAGALWLISGSAPVSAPPVAQSKAPSPAGPESNETDHGTTTVALEVIAACWTEARVDGRIVFSGTLSPGDSPSWSGKSIDLILGNAAGVTLTVNGQNRGIPGAVGERKELRFGNGS